MLFQKRVVGVDSKPDAGSDPGVRAVEWLKVRWLAYSMAIGGLMVVLSLPVILLEMSEDPPQWSPAIGGVVGVLPYVAAGALIMAGLLWSRIRAHPPQPQAITDLVRLRAERADSAGRSTLLFMTAALFAGGIGFVYAGELTVREAAARVEKTRIEYEAMERGLPLAAGRVLKLQDALLARHRELSSYSGVFDEFPELQKQIAASVSALETSAKDLNYEVELVPLVAPPGAEKSFERAIKQSNELLAEVIEEREIYAFIFRQRGSAQGAYEAAKTAANDFGRNSLKSMIIRAGLILLVIFLVQILSTLQRYHVQLSGHYNAIADVLEHARQKELELTVEEFDRAVATFRPRVEMGKGAKALPQEVVELAIAALKRK